MLDWVSECSIAWQEIAVGILDSLHLSLLENFFKCTLSYLQVFPNGTKNAKLLSFQICRLHVEKLESVREDGKG